MLKLKPGGKGISLIEMEMPKTPREIMEMYLKLVKEDG
jgi:hypothetical protein